MNHFLKRELPATSLRSVTAYHKACRFESQANLWLLPPARQLISIALLDNCGAFCCPERNNNDLVEKNRQQAGQLIRPEHVVPFERFASIVRNLLAVMGFSRRSQERNVIAGQLARRLVRGFF
ncbi:MAG: hypothetical protein VB912_13310 [Pirellulaceae bacterium]